MTVPKREMSAAWIREMIEWAKARNTVDGVLLAFCEGVVGSIEDAECAKDALREILEEHVPPGQDDAEGLAEGVRNVAARGLRRWRCAFHYDRIATTEDVVNWTWWRRGNDERWLIICPKCSEDKRKERKFGHVVGGPHNGKEVLPNPDGTVSLKPEEAQ